MVLDANGGPLGLFYTVHGRRLVSFSESAAARVSASARARTHNVTVASQRVHAARSSHTTHDILALWVVIDSHTTHDILSLGRHLPRLRDIILHCT
jgi:hypothetical protein